MRSAASPGMRRMMTKMSTATMKMAGAVKIIRLARYCRTVYSL